MNNVLIGKNNLKPEIWGPYYWKTFHYSALGYPDNCDESCKDSYRSFYINFSKVLPCDSCSIKSQEYMKTVDWEQVLKDRDNLLKWSYDFHDYVNDTLNKKSPNFKDFLSGLNNVSSKNNDYIFYTVILMIALFIIIILRTTH